jgi:hypothetical protein
MRKIRTIRAIIAMGAIVAFLGAMGVQAASAQTYYQIVNGSAAGCVTEENDVVYYTTPASDCGSNHALWWSWGGNGTPFKNEHYGWCLSVDGDDPGVYAGSCSGNDAQNWSGGPVPFSIQNDHTHYCLYLYDGGLRQGACPSGDTLYEWFLSTVAGG